MKKNPFLIYFLFLILFAPGCGVAVEGAKEIWGSSTKALEKARPDALSKTFPCSVEDCFNEVFAMTKQVYVYQPVYGDEAITPTPTPTPAFGEESADVTPTEVVGSEVTSEPGAEAKVKVEEPFLNRFIVDRRNKMMVVMSVPGNIDTTEVGVFFVELPDGQTRVEISSLSSSAKVHAADILFPHLEKKFSAPKISSTP